MAPSQPDTLMQDLRRPFAPNDLEWRIQRSGIFQDQGGNTKVWATLAPYITARAVMDRLDEVFGPMGWEIRYTPWDSGKPGVVGELRVQDPATKAWITKQDGAEQPKEQADQLMSVKGGFSGALKRTAVALGIGRSLYNIGDVFAEISLQKKQGWTRATAKNSGQGDPKKLTFWWIAPAVAVRQVCGLGPNDPIDEVPSRGSAAEPQGASERRPTPPAQAAAPAKDPSPEKATTAQLSHLKNLMSASLFTEDERIAASEEYDTLTKAQASQRIAAVQKALEHRKALLSKAQPATVAAGRPPENAEGDGDDDLPF